MAVVLSLALVAVLALAFALTRGSDDPLASPSGTPTAPGPAASPGATTPSSPDSSATPSETSASSPGTTTPEQTSPTAPLTPAPTRTGRQAGPTMGPTAPARPTRSGPTSVPEIPRQEPVELTETATFGDGVTAQLTSIRAVQGEARGIGEIAGPALRVDVSVTNSTPDVLVLDLATVNLTYGRERVPATLLLGDPATQQLSGVLAPAGTASAVYVFSVPTDQRDQIAVEVNYEALSPIVVFEGSAPTA